MFTTYTNQDSVSSNDSEISSISCNTVQYGPISVRVCRKAAPTLETGRRSKHLVLVGDEAVRREKRRERNREAARKLKEKRQLIEEELNKKIHELENQHSNLQNFLHILNEKKRLLESEVNKFLSDPINELLLNDNHDLRSFLEQYSNDLDLFDESIDRILDSDLDIDFQPVTQNS